MPGRFCSPKSAPARFTPRSALGCSATGTGVGPLPQATANAAAKMALLVFMVSSRFCLEGRGASRSREHFDAIFVEEFQVAHAEIVVLGRAHDERERDELTRIEHIVRIRVVAER